MSQFLPFDIKEAIQLEFKAVPMILEHPHSISEQSLFLDPHKDRSALVIAVNGGKRYAIIELDPSEYD